MHWLQQIALALTVAGIAWFLVLGGPVLMFRTKRDLDKTVYKISALLIVVTGLCWYGGGKLKVADDHRREVSIQQRIRELQENPPYYAH